MVKINEIRDQNSGSLKMKAVLLLCFFELPATDYPVTRHHIAKEWSPQPHRAEDFKIRTG